MSVSRNQVRDYIKQWYCGDGKNENETPQFLSGSKTVEDV